MRTPPSGAREFDDLCCEAKHCSGEATMADFLGELLSVGKPKVNLFLSFTS